MKKVMFIFMGIVIGIVGTSYAAYKLKAEQVSFDKTNTNLNSENVQDSIDEVTALIKYGDAEESDIASGKTALVKGKKITGIGSEYEVIAYAKETTDTEKLTKTTEKSYKYIITFDSKSNWSLGLNNRASTISNYEKKTLVEQIQGKTNADDVYFANVTIYENVPAGSVITLGGDLQVSNKYGRLHVAIGIN